MILSYANIIPYVINQLSWVQSLNRFDDYITTGNYLVKENLGKISLSKNRCFSIEDKQDFFQNYFLKQPRNFIKDNVRPVVRESIFYQTVYNNTDLTIIEHLPFFYDYNSNDIILIFEFLSGFKDLQDVEFELHDKINFIVRIGEVLKENYENFKTNLNIFEDFSPFFKEDKPLPLLEIDFNNIEFQKRFRGDLEPFILEIFKDNTFVEIVKKSQKYFNCPESATLIHGDLKFRNIMTDYDQIFDGDNVSKALIYIVDWEFASIGNPLFDLATLYYYLIIENKFDIKNTKQTYSEQFNKLLNGYGIPFPTHHEQDIINTFISLRIIDYLIRNLKKDREIIKVDILKNAIKEVQTNSLFK